MLKRKILAATIAATLCGTSHAEIDINGFASIKGGMALSNDDTLYGYDDDFSFKNESLAALQVKSDLGDKLSVTAQLLGRGADDWDVKFEWAFLSYDLTDTLRVNAGRLRTPFYKYSDFRDVGYAYDWSRVPQSVYGLGFDNIEGASLYHTTTLGNFDSSLQFIVGSYDGDAAIGSSAADAQIENITGIAWELGQDGYSFRLAYLTGKTTFYVDQLDSPAGLYAQLTGFGLGALAKDLDIVDESSSFAGIGFNIDKNDWLVVSEITKATVNDSFISDQESYYISIGHRFDTITPYVSFEKEDNKAKTEIYAGVPTASPIFAPVAGLVNSLETERNSINVGVRYDFHPSAAFKAQYTNADNKTADRKDSVLVVGVDLVF
ncbi:porin [Rheinheimera mangrovi]|uniref:porin n=1 Tax=Rheinheimera mangrovi TaxID=2498451 RepID=UPI000F8D2413|nr:porin [Rheinheimera mangrovi]